MKHTVTRDRRRMLRADYAALGPYSLWALLFILVPLVFVAYYAFTDNNFQFTLENVQRFFTATSSVLQEDGSSAEVHTYLLIFWRSLKLAVISTVNLPGAGLSPGLIMAPGQAQNPEDFP